MLKSGKQKGFTIIEVVLVLAVAGLIFLVVFLAVPSLQRSQRDTQRRQDAGRFISQIGQYQSNNRGKVPSVATLQDNFIERYLLVDEDVWSDPKTDSQYEYTEEAAPSEPGLFYYGVNMKCDGENAVSGGGARSVVVVMKLEGSGQYCVDNQ